MKLVSPATIAKRLGVSSRTVRRWIISGEIPGCKVRSRYYVQRDALDMWLETKRTKRTRDVDGV